MTIDGVPDQSWDFFVSYTQADRGWAEWLAWLLEEDGHRVLIQAWDFPPGSDWIHGMQAGVAGATRTVAVLSKDYLTSVYGGAEWRAAWAADPEGREHKLLTVRVGDCDRTGLLAGVVGVDVFDVDEAEARARVLTMVAGALAGRAKPATAPPFPAPARPVVKQAQFPGALPRVWNVPARNPHFTGRSDSLAALERGLAAGATVTVQSVHGMGGIGKTQLAVEYAHRHATDYDAVWWIAAEEPALLPGQFAALATRLGRQPESDPAALRELVHDALRQVPGWLLVFDNADSVEDIAGWIPVAPLPAGVPGHVVVTTRRGGFSTVGRVHDLDVVDPDEAVQLMRSRIPHLARDAALRIADRLGRLPLALEQAAAYVDRTGMPADDYLRLLRTRARDMYGRGAVPNHTETIATLWDLSLERVAAESPAALQLMAVCAYLAPVGIPLDLFTRHPGELPEPLASTVADPLALHEAVAVAIDYSLGNRTAGGLQLHRLIQGALRLRDRPAGPGAAGSLAVAVKLLRADAPAMITGKPENWPRWSVLLPHALAATEHFDDDLGAAGVAGPFRPVADDCAWLLHRSAIHLRVHARLDDARPLLERSLQITEAVHGPDHPDMAGRLNDLALILRGQGHAEQALPLARRALQITEAVYGPNHPEVAGRLNDVALILRGQGHAEQALPLARSALRITETVYGPDHADVASRLDNLATILRALGRAQEAEGPAERAVRITEAVHGPDHPSVATAWNSLAAVRHDLRRPEDARPLAERAVRITEAVHGPDHPDVAVGLSNLAHILTDLGRAGEAGPLAERALAITEGAYGPDHPVVAIRLNNLAAIRHRTGESAAALPLAERALRTTEAVYGPDHPDVAIRLHNLATILRALGQDQQSRTLAARAAAITGPSRSGMRL